MGEVIANARKVTRALFGNSRPNKTNGHRIADWFCSANELYVPTGI